MQKASLSYYDRGATPFFALGKDLRVSYCLFVPPSYEEAGHKPYDLIVMMHGTERGAATYRDKMADFAIANDAIVLAPLFPCNLLGPGDLDNYKLLIGGGIRFDLLLLAMIDEVAEKYRLNGDRFLLHGFSGGGHFAHRFAYLHPERLKGVSIGAPGVVTLLDEGRDWWVGLANFASIFGKPFELDELRKVPVHMIVGDQDRETWEITIPETSPWWMDGANSAGATRIERLKSLAESFRAHGIDVQFDLVPGVAHDGWAVLEPVRHFFAACLAARPLPQQVKMAPPSQRT